MVSYMLFYFLYSTVYFTIWICMAHVFLIVVRMLAPLSEKYHIDGGAQLRLINVGRILVLRTVTIS